MEMSGGGTAARGARRAWQVLARTVHDAVHGGGRRRRRRRRRRGWRTVDIGRTQPARLSSTIGSTRRSSRAVSKFRAVAKQVLRIIPWDAKYKSVATRRMR